MQALSPLIDLASQKSLDLFFRLGQGYVARTDRDPAQRAPGHGLNPVGAHSHAAARLDAVFALRPRPQKLHAWPDGPPRRA